MPRGLGSGARRGGDAAELGQDGAERRGVGVGLSQGEVGGSVEGVELVVDGDGAGRGRVGLVGLAGLAGFAGLIGPGEGVTFTKGDVASIIVPGDCPIWVLARA